jgi:hypothetical protein
LPERRLAAVGTGPSGAIHVDAEVARRHRDRVERELAAHQLGPQRNAVDRQAVDGGMSDADARARPPRVRCRAAAADARAAFHPPPRRRHQQVQAVDVVPRPRRVLDRIAEPDTRVERRLPERRGNVAAHAIHRAVGPAGGDTK